MRALRLAPACGLALVAGCLAPQNVFECSDSEQCLGGGLQGSCEANGFCSFPDPSCPGGSRFGEAGGAGIAGTCVGSGVDAGAPLADADPLTCGNGDPDDGEQCDDGNDDDTDGCIDCRFATCGDNHVRAGVEACDDGNTDGGDSCESSCLDCSMGNAHTVWAGNGHCYGRFDATGNWAAARAACIGRGGYLATVSSDAENAAARAVLGSSSVYWIGMNDLAVEDTWLWEDDSELAFTAWRGGTDPAPNGGTAENCGVQWSSDGVWGDRACTDNWPSLCEWDTWSIDPATGHAYRYLGGGGLATYDSAATACAALGGGAHLAHVDAAAEQTYLQALLGRAAWIDIPAVASQCVTLDPAGTAVMATCTTPAAYVCEID